MNKKNTILELMYETMCRKEELRDNFSLKSTRAIENYIADLNDFLHQKSQKVQHLIELSGDKGEIIYDKTLKKYRFNTLLPTLIPYKILHNFIEESISNIILSDDFKILQELAKREDCFTELPLIKTDKLSNLMQNIIQIKLALLLNYSLKMEYKKNDNVETKFIDPHSLVSSAGAYYLYASYHSDNLTDIGQKRSFALSGIVSIAAHERSKKNLFEDVKGNAWGAYDKSILLRLQQSAAFFYKREGFAQSNALSFISEEPDGSIIAKMRYANEQDLINFIQKWMPHVSVAKDQEKREEIYSSIQKNLLNLMVQ